ncbi:MAG: hypothetical protein ACRDBG_10925 [Waterburya sp.]
MYIATQQSLSDIIQENLVNGRLSIRAVARLLEVSSHQRIILDGTFASQKLGQILTEQGFQAGTLLENGFCAKSFWLTLEYFAYESKAKASGAKQLARTFGQIGVMTAFEKFSEPKPEPLPRQLPPIRDSIQYLEAAQGIQELKNPMLKSLLEQRLMEDLGATKQLTGNSENDLVICTVLAREMGFDLKPNQDGQLGKWVAKYHEPKGKTQHGRYSVNVYLRNEIEETVASFFR